MYAFAHIMSIRVNELVSTFAHLTSIRVNELVSAFTHITSMKENELVSAYAHITSMTANQLVHAFAHVTNIDIAILVTEGLKNMVVQISLNPVHKTPRMCNGMSDTLVIGQGHD